MRFSSGPIPLYREFIEVSSCKKFRPKAHPWRMATLQRRKVQTCFSEKSIFSPKSSAFFRPRIKTFIISLKALQITFRTQKPDPKSVKRFQSYCPQKPYQFSRKGEDAHLRNRLWCVCLPSYFPVNLWKKLIKYMRMLFDAKIFDDVIASWRADVI